MPLFCDIQIGSSVAQEVLGYAAPSPVPAPSAMQIAEADAQDIIFVKDGEVVHVEGGAFEPTSKTGRSFMPSDALLRIRVDFPNVPTRASNQGKVSNVSSLIITAQPKADISDVYLTLFNIYHDNDDYISRIISELPKMGLAVDATGFITTITRIDSFVDIPADFTRSYMNVLSGSREQAYGLSCNNDGEIEQKEAKIYKECWTSRPFNRIGESDQASNVPAERKANPTLVAPPPVPAASRSGDEQGSNGCSEDNAQQAKDPREIVSRAGRALGDLRGIDDYAGHAFSRSPFFSMLHKQTR